MTTSRRRPVRSVSPYRRHAVVVAALALAATVALTLLAGLSWPVGWVLGAGAATFAAFAWDKWRARTGGGRTPEAVLLAMILLGGVLGGWAGLLLVRHKTRKPRFWVALLAATATWAAVAALTLGWPR